MRRLLVALTIAAGCGGKAPAPAPAAAPANVVEPAAPEVVKPPGYLEMRAGDVVAVGDGAAVLLVDPVSEKVIPIFIGGTEGMAIALRLRGESAPRPLTHDLLDAAVKALGAEIVKVQIDELRDTIFHGSVYLRSGSRLLRLDARSSDAIALAIGNRVPIYVAQAVLDEAGRTLEELMRQPDDAASPGSSPAP
jgi:bifunctional DNase/RNase